MKISKSALDATIEAFKDEWLSPEDYEDGMTNVENMAVTQCNWIIQAYSERLPDLVGFIESITDATGPYKYLDGKQIIIDARNVLAKMEQ